MTTMTATDDATETGSFTRPWLLISAATVAVKAVLQYFGSRLDPDPAIRASWVQDLTATLMMAAIAGGISYGVAAWALRGDAPRQTRAVVGLSIFAILLAPVFWFSAAPVIVAAAAVILGLTTGVTRRDGGSTAARSLAIVASLAAVATLTVTIGGTIAEAL